MLCASQRWCVGYIFPSRISTTGHTHKVIFIPPCLQRVSFRRRVSEALFKGPVNAPSVAVFPNNTGFLFYFEAPLPIPSLPPSNHTPLSHTYSCAVPSDIINLSTLFAWGLNSLSVHPGITPARFSRVLFGGFWVLISVFSKGYQINLFPLIKNRCLFSCLVIFCELNLHLKAKCIPWNSWGASA